ncbi:MAG TPA: acyltransferase family protein [Rhodanobacteraceae bacterium]|nr:acyltransferase family protein [Rhodanobacteraceae bacterium]
MIRESAAHWTETVYRPLRRVGRQVWGQGVSRPPRAARRPDRFPALDNARFVLIALVVVGHLIEQLVHTGPAADALYRWIYLFHMPAFVLISGALSSPVLTRRRLVRIVTGLLLPYVLFQTLYPAWDAWLFGTGDWSQGYLTPYWLLWYLLSLACWRVMLPVFARLKYPLPIALAIALAAGAVSWIGYPFSLSRTLVFFPLFLLGFRLRAWRLQHLGETGMRKGLAILVLAGTAAGAWFLRDLDPQWLYASVDYATLGVTSLAGAGIRLGLLVASSACALSVLTLVPRRPRWAGAGRRSIDAYLLHGFLVRAALAAGGFAWLDGAMPEGAALVVVIAAAWMIAAILSTRMVDRMARPLMHPADWTIETWHGIPWRAIRARVHALKRLY